MKYLFAITLLLSSCFSNKIKNDKQYNSNQIIPLESIDTNKDGNISVVEINSYKSQSNKAEPFKIFLILIGSVLLISTAPYLLNLIQNKNVSKNQQKK